MTFFDWLVFASWVVFVGFWFVSAFGVKRNVKKAEWRRDAGIRILMVAIVIVLLRLASSWHIDIGYQFSTTAQGIGAVLCVVGIAFAIWARVHLGKNWSGMPSMKEGHELVTSGPYRFVRHPIYTGIIVAVLGSGLVTGVVWLAVFGVVIVNFLYRIPLEERYMMQLFPDEYPGYKKRTKALIPFIW